jgi:hypothetical protein
VTLSFLHVPITTTNNEKRHTNFCRINPLLVDGTFELQLGRRILKMDVEVLESSVAFFNSLQGFPLFANGVGDV